MRKVLAGSVVVLMVLFLSAGFGLAGNGKGSGTGTGGGGGGMGISDVCSGSPVVVTGTVYADISTGSGLEIDTEGGVIVVVYGIGPYRYWEEKGIDRPTVGEAVTVDGMEVTFTDGTVKIIAMSITVDGEELLQLREPCDGDVPGVPLWRGKNKQPIE